MWIVIGSTRSLLSSAGSYSCALSVFRKPLQTWLLCETWGVLTTVQGSFPWRALRRLHFPTSPLIVEWDHGTSWPLDHEQKWCMSLLAWVKLKNSVGLFNIISFPLGAILEVICWGIGAIRGKMPGLLSHCMESHHGESPDLSRLQPKLSLF